MKWLFKQLAQRTLISSPAKIVLIYVLVGVFWVAASNELLVFLVRDPEILTYIEIVKDWFFILLTAGLLYLLIERALRALRSSEAALLENKRTLSTLLSNLPGMAYRCRNDSSWTMEFVSDGCAGLTGYPPPDLIGNTAVSYAQLIHPDDEAMVWNDVQAALHESRPFKLIYRIITARGEEKWVWEQGREVPSAGGAVAMLEGFITDITVHRKAIDELKKHQDRLEELVRERTRELESAQQILIQREKLKTLGVIAAEVAHEIRNPLVAVGGFAKRLYKKNPDLHECGIIYQESLRLEKILDRIKKYLTPVALQRVPCFINDIIAECVDLLSPEIERRHIHCSVHLEKAQGPLYADPDILSQIIINVMNHALESMGEQGELSIQDHEDEHTIYVDFRCPLTKGTLLDPEQLFMPFDEGGEEIGLPFAYRLAKDMDGLISVSQEEQHMIFTVSLSKALNAAAP